MGILPHHSPVLTVLQFGVIASARRGKTSIFTVAGGVAEVQPDQVTVLADAAKMSRRLTCSAPKKPGSGRRALERRRRRRYRHLS
jgi:F0F1-type ATP synthase epsilon subunit